MSQILARKAVLEKSIKRLEKRLELERSEHENIITALNVMQSFGFTVDESKTQYITKPQTIGDMAIMILGENPDGLPAIDILEKIQNRWMPELMRSSLSPPLSRLKQRGEVAQERDIWRLNKENPEQPHIFADGVAWDEFTELDSIGESLPS